MLHQIFAPSTQVKGLQRLTSFNTSCFLNRYIFSFVKVTKADDVGVRYFHNFLNSNRGLNFFSKLPRTGQSYAALKLKQRPRTTFRLICHQHQNETLKLSRDRDVVEPLLEEAKFAVPHGQESQEEDSNIFNWLINDRNEMKVLNVAEKNDAAKRISGLLSGGTAQTKNTYSKYNKIYEFPYNFRRQQCTMVMTSVSGHLLGYDFTDRHRKWHSCDPVELFEASVVKSCPENYKDIKKTLEGLAPYCHILVIWTDCDREGENIGFEVIDVCKSINPRLEVYRAKFSEITPMAVTRAINNLIPPDKRLSDAVDVRSELDLRIGAAFTRFQTLRLQKRFPGLLSDKLISYGSCQFPTLGFVVERYKAIVSFIPEDFWKIEVGHSIENCSVDFNWARVRLFNELAVRVLFEKCQDNPIAKVVKVQSKPKSKWRPVALDTVEFEKMSSRMLKIGAKNAMKIAEKLYTQGIISYPRTETNIFPQGLDLIPLIQAQTASNHWGGFAVRLLQSGPNPRNGKKTDEAHPPIHPTRFDANLHGDEAKVYELIVRHFLACCSKDAIGTETTVEIEIAEERFVGHGLRILERNYLEVYPYDKWSDKELPHFEEGQTFRPTKLEMTGSHTCPPNLLTEADLISLMEKHGIGTDATHAEHIETIKQRMYVGVEDGKFVPGQLGMGLVEGYDAMGFQMSKPHLRSELEADLKKIGEGRKDPNAVLREQVKKYKEVFVVATDQVNQLDAAVGRCLDQDPNAAPPPPPPRNPPPGPGGGGGGFGGRGGGPYDIDDDDDDDEDNHGGGRGRPGGSAYSGAGNAGNRGGRSRGGQVQRGVPRARPAPQNLTGEGGAGDGGGTCNCGQVPPTRTVQKDNENKGRPFKSCNTCGFFDWCDEGQGGKMGGSSSSGGGPNYSNSNYGASTAPFNNNSNRSNGPAIRLPRTTNQSSSSYPSYPPPPPASYGSKTPYGSNPPDYGQDKNNTTGVGASGIPNCNCQLPAIPLTVKKDGANKGRHFFGCAKGYSDPEKCNFFQWDDEGIGARGTGSRSAPSRSNDDGSGSSEGFVRNRGAAGASKRGARGGGGVTGGPRKARRCTLCKEEGHTKRNCPLSVNHGEFEEDMY